MSSSSSPSVEDLEAPDPPLYPQPLSPTTSTPAPAPAPSPSSAPTTTTTLKSFCFPPPPFVLLLLFVRLLYVVLAACFFLAFFFGLSSDSSPPRLLGRPPCSSTSTSACSEPTFQIGNEPSCLFWFVQISDLHLNRFDNSTVRNFNRFCSEVLPVIAPSFVIATGDLVQGYGKSYFVGKCHQSADEWALYKNVLDAHSLFNSSFWYDVRGNHDGFCTDHRGSASDFTSTYTVSGSPSVQKHVFSNSCGRYEIVGFDNVPDPSIRNNYFGVGKSFLSLAADISPHLYNHTFVFSHYPLNMMASVESLAVPCISVFKNKSIHPSVYLSGHLHKWNAYTRNEVGFLELSLVDFVDETGFRVMVVDHDLISFTDSVSGEWPLIVISSPKDSQLLSDKEPLHLMRNSSHIRCLIFSPSSIISVKAIVDGSVVCDEMTSSSTVNPLFSCAWSSSEFSFGKHEIEIIAVDAQNRSKSVKNIFSLDGSVSKFQGFNSRWLRIHVVQWIFFLTVTVSACCNGLLLFSPVVIRTFKINKKLRVERGEISFQEFVQNENLSWLGQILTVLTWDIHMTMYRYSSIPFIRRCLCICCGSWPMIMPISTGFFGVTHWSIAFMWGVYSNNKYTTHILILVGVMIFNFMIFAPAISAFSYQSTFKLEKRFLRPRSQYRIGLFFRWDITVLWIAYCGGISLLGSSSVIMGFPSVLISPAAVASTIMLSICSYDAFILLRDEWHLKTGKDCDSQRLLSPMDELPDAKVEDFSLHGDPAHVSESCDEL